ncbi:hypothetical protein CCHR01_00479 [Colletotrichum chrysophilum]|uniref:Uncharacterized protein n=1 Tax=Colletotrichum chrysophilum TaxID=1836956 RepID=A0AAD9AZW6_9PEZI|nr:hypothetical protein CCHR01_00479 [Colletotrichum chrysophilum]
MPWLRWLRKKKQDNAASDDVVIEGLFPWLPSASHGPRSTPSQQECWLFSQPAELRRKILEEAFGNCTIHIDLRLQPISRMPCRTLSSPHGGDAPLVEEEGNRPAARSKTWKWYGCVCHRNKPPQPRLAQQTSLYLDRCLYGEGICDAWPGEAPGKCCIGMMGVMLSCKQAHDEVLGVIYSTNTIHIASEPLVQALLQRGLRDSPRVMGPGIGLVTSLEIKWRFDLFSDSIDRVCTEYRRRFTQSLQLLPQAFPGLSRLTLAFEDRLYYKRLRPSDNMAEVDAYYSSLSCQLRQASSLKASMSKFRIPFLTSFGWSGTWSVAKFLRVANGTIGMNGFVTLS